MSIRLYKTLRLLREWNSTLTTRQFIINSVSTYRYFIHLSRLNGDLMRKLLVISDDSQFINQFHTLSDYQVNVATETSDIQPLDANHTRVYQLILLDITAQHYQPAQVFEQIQHSHSRVIIVTNCACMAVASAYLAAGAIDYIMKPSHPELLRTRLEANTRFDPNYIVEFARFAAHQLKNPLMSLKGYSSVILAGMTGEINEEQADFLQIMFNNAERLDNLINDLRDLAIIDAGAMDMPLETVDIFNLLNTVNQNFVGRFSAKTQNFHNHLWPEIPAVLGNPIRLTQLLTILLDNAHRYTPEEGHITIKADHNDCWLQISVQDTGIGIQNDEHEQVLTSRHFRSSDRKVQHEAGNGLGLYIARHIVAAHGGQLWFESEYGRGTTFYFTLPLDV